MNLSLLLKQIDVIKIDSRVASEGIFCKKIKLEKNLQNL